MAIIHLESLEGITDYSTALQAISEVFTKADTVYPKDGRKSMNEEISKDTTLKSYETSITSKHFFKHLSKRRINKISYFLIGFIILLLIIIGVLAWALYECNQNKSGDCVYSCGNKSNNIVTYKNTKWPAMDKNHAFSIKIINKNQNKEDSNSKDQEICLQGGPDNKLVLKKGCDDDSIRFIAKADGKLQKFKGTQCLNPSNIDKSSDSPIVFTDNCTDNTKEEDIGRLNFTFESDGKIKHSSSNRCIYAPIDMSSTETLATLRDCKFGTNFELI